MYRQDIDQRALYNRRYSKRPLRFQQRNEQRSSSSPAETSPLASHITTKTRSHVLSLDDGHVARRTPSERRDLNPGTLQIGTCARRAVPNDFDVIQQRLRAVVCPFAFSPREPDFTIVGRRLPSVAQWRVRRTPTSRSTYDHSDAVRGSARQSSNAASSPGANSNQVTKSNGSPRSPA